MAHPASRSTSALLARLRPWLRGRGFPAPAGRWGRHGLRAVPLLAALLLGIPFIPQRQVLGGGLFVAQAVDASRFIVLGRPVADDDWTLLVLEQLAPSPSCWTARPDGLVDPSLNRFNYTAICSRYIDSNGYSVRAGEVDLAPTLRLHLVQVGQELRLQATGDNLPVELLVGRGTVPLRDRDGFVALKLEPGWSLQRRAYLGRGLSHLYFANSEPLPALVAQARAQPLGVPGGLVDPVVGQGLPGRGRLSGSNALSGAALARLPDPALASAPGRPIPLQVIPFRE